jgi:hypothetical protein
MKIADSNNQKYASYKNNLIFESIISTPDRDRFYGLSREHIELTLGIKFRYSWSRLISSLKIKS